jgi:hypothetical protein
MFWLSVNIGNKKYSINKSGNMTTDALIISPFFFSVSGDIEEKENLKMLYN